MFEVMEAGGRPVRMWLPEGHEVEEEARQQLGRVSRLPFVTHIACMPDVHLGKGATIGSVIGTERALVPAAVGVDIGCGMTAQRLELWAGGLPNLSELRAAIEKRVPHGRTNDGQKGDRGAFGTVPDLHKDVWEKGPLLDLYHGELLEKHPKLEHEFALNQLGTLGTGNHFIEVCLDEEDQVWIVLHSGSRGPGAKIGNYFTKLAQQVCKLYHVPLEDPALAYLPEGTSEFDDYVQAVNWAQSYAAQSRELMLWATLDALNSADGLSVSEAEPPIDCHHNFAAREYHGGKNIWVTRKGATRAREGDLGIIPGSMGAKSFIVRGKGNPNSLHSCSHGAGRIMSRTQAKKAFSVMDLEAATSGVECLKDVSVLDEAPGAYKDIDAVIAAQSELVEPIHTLRQVVCVKGGDKRNGRRRR